MVKSGLTGGGKLVSTKPLLPKFGSSCCEKTGKAFRNKNTKTKARERENRRSMDFLLRDNCG
jgi:hypothetical protein